MARGKSSTQRASLSPSLLQQQALSLTSSTAPEEMLETWEGCYVIWGWWVLFKKKEERNERKREGGREGGEGKTIQHT